MAAEQRITDNLDIWSSAIKAKSAAGRGKSNKLELYGVKKLRELILELAVRGLLAPQDPSDEPASELLTKIAAQKAKLIKGGVIKKQKVLPPIEGNESSFVLPENWAWARLETAIIQVTDGEHLSPKKTETGVKLLTAKHVRDNGVTTADPQYVSKEDAEKFLLRCRPEIGDVLICSRGTIGRSCVNEVNEIFCLMGSVILLKKSEYISSRYLSCFIKSQIGQLFIRGVTKGMAVNALYLKDIKLCPISIPPFEEQHRIVAKVDELMALCDQLEQQQEASISAQKTLVKTLLGALTSASERDGFEEAWARIADHFDSLFITEWSIDQLKQAILQLAVTGKLVPQDSTDGPASELLERITAVKAQLVRDGKIKKQKSLPPIEEGEKQFELPAGWEWCRLQETFDVRDGTHDSPKDSAGGKTYPLVTSKNFVGGEIDFDGARRISEEDHLEISKRSLVEVGDILFSMIGGNIGNQVMVEDPRPFSVKNVALFKYFLRSATLPRYFKIYTEELAIELQDNASGGAQPFISLGALRKLVFALPPADEQQRVVNKVDELMALCDTLKGRIITAQTTQLQLADAVAQQAAS